MSQKKRLDILDHIKIEEPCHERWASMRGDERKRFCEKCSKCVVDLSQMTRKNAERHLTKNISKGICVRFVSDSNGALKFKVARTIPSIVRSFMLLFASTLTMMGIPNALYAEESGTPPPRNDHREEVALGKIAVITPAPTDTVPTEVMGGVTMAQEQSTATPTTKKYKP